MSVFRWVAGALLVALLAFTGGASAVTLLEDDAGDATQRNGGYASNTCAGLAPPLTEECFRAPAEGGVPAPPDRDILAVEAEVDADALVLSLVVPQLEERPMESTDAGIEYAVCLDKYCAWTAEGLTSYSMLYAGDVACGLPGYCFWDVPFERDVGSPGRVSWRIPLAILPDAWQPSYIAARIGNIAEGPSGASVSVPVHAFGAAYAGTTYYIADVAEGPLEIDLGLVPGVVTATFPIHLQDDGEPEEDPAKDLRSYDVLESPTEFTVRIGLSEVAEEPQGVAVLTVLHFVGGRGVFLDVQGVDGEWTSTAWRCEEIDDEQGFCVRSVSVESAFSVEPGTPGTLVWTLGRREVGAPQAGHLAAETWAYATTAPARVQDSGAVVGTSRFDVLAAGPVRLVHDSAVAERAEALDLVSDPIGDVAVEMLLPETDDRGLDLTFLEAQGVDSSSSRVSLGVADLTDTAIPVGFHAVVYAVGVETDAGRFMVGLYRSEAAQEFFCAQDTLVFQQPRVHPASVARQPILGAVATGASGAPTDATAGGASITYFIPHACFAHVGDAPVVARRMAAGVFLIQDPTGRQAQAEISVADDVAFADPVLLEAASVVAAPAPWYANPFGIDNFYDITGVLLAVAVSGVGVVAVQRKRSLLRRYLREVDDAAALKESKPRQRALEDVRARLKRDLARGRISEGHYHIVERRLDAALAAARSAALRLAFADLPLALVDTLDALLADGDMSPDDYRVFLTKLEGSANLTAEAKERARARVRQWVADSD